MGLFLTLSNHKYKCYQIKNSINNDRTLENTSTKISSLANANIFITIDIISLILFYTKLKPLTDLCTQIPARSTSKFRFRRSMFWCSVRLRSSPTWRLWTREDTPGCTSIRTCFHESRKSFRTREDKAVRRYLQVL